MFDALLARGQIVVHASEVERTAALATLYIRADTLVIADTREQVNALNAAIRDHRLTTGEVDGEHPLITRSGEPLGVGDRVATRRNDHDLRVANRDTWTVTGLGGNSSLRIVGPAGERNGERSLPADYVRKYVELAYATTAYGAQGETVDQAHFLVGDATGASAAYVGMARGRKRNTAHLVADSVEDARCQWVDVFNRDRADLGPVHAAKVAAQDIERYGPQLQAAALRAAVPGTGPRRPPEPYPTSTPAPRPGIGR
ncbi:MAG: hypothetical protein ACR2K3_12920 [Nocardioides sp.]